MLTDSKLTQDRADANDVERLGSPQNMITSRKRQKIMKIIFENRKVKLQNITEVVRI